MEKKELKLELEVEEVQIILNHLQEGSFRVVKELIQKILTQSEMQLKVDDVDKIDG